MVASRFEAVPPVSAASTGRLRFRQLLPFAVERALYVLLMGLLISIFTIGLGAVDPQNTWHQWTSDLVMRAFSGMELEQGERLRFVHVALEEPLCKPGVAMDVHACEPKSPGLIKKLAAKLNMAMSAHAKAIVIDLYVPPPSTADDIPTRAAKEELRDAVASAGVPVFIMRATRRKFGSSDYEWVPSVFDPIKKDPVRFGHVIWNPDRDGVVRRSMPSIQVSSDFRNDSKPQDLCGLSLLVAQFFTTREGVGCQSDGVFLFDLTERTPWWISLMRLDARTDGFSVLERVSLSQIEKPDAEGLKIFGGAIVVFGSSGLSGDSYNSPLDALSGAELIVNHVHALVNLPPLKLPSVLQRFTHEAQIVGIATIAVFAFWIHTLMRINRSTSDESAQHRLALSQRKYRPSPLQYLCSALILGAVMLLLAICEVRGAGISMQHGILVEPFAPLSGFFVEVALYVIDSAVQLVHRASVALSKLI